jgi:hypothetical protein
MNLSRKSKLEKGSGFRSNLSYRTETRASDWRVQSPGLRFLNDEVQPLPNILMEQQAFHHWND